jgi:hypothetical protein
MLSTSSNFLPAMGRIFSFRRAFLMATSAIFAVRCGLFLSGIRMWVVHKMYLTKVDKKINHKKNNLTEVDLFCSLKNGDKKVVDKKISHKKGTRTLVHEFSRFKHVNKKQADKIISLK